MLRAIRRANASGRPSASSNGSTVTASAPPTPAASLATVVRSMFTHGSRRGHHHRRGHRVLDAARRPPAPRTPRRPAPTAGGPRAAWRSSGTGRRWPRSGTPAAGRPGRRSARPRSAPADRRHRSPARRPAPAAAEPPASWYGSASTVSARSPGYSSAHSARQRGRPARSPTASPVRASWPSGSRAEVAARPPPWRRPAPRTAAATPVRPASTSAPASSTTGARSRYTPSRAWASDGHRDRRPPPTVSQSEVTPFSRSASTASLAGGSVACRCRTSQPPTVFPSGRPPRTKGAKPGKPGRARRRARCRAGGCGARPPARWTARPRPSAPETSLPDLRSTPSTRRCHCSGSCVRELGGQ